MGEPLPSSRLDRAEVALCRLKAKPGGGSLQRKMRLCEPTVLSILPNGSLGRFSVCVLSQCMYSFRQGGEAGRGSLAQRRAGMGKRSGSCRAGYGRSIRKLLHPPPALTNHNGSQQPLLSLSDSSWAQGMCLFYTEMVIVFHPLATLSPTEPFFVIGSGVM